jgi:hypothetical protein
MVRSSDCELSRHQTVVIELGELFDTLLKYIQQSEKLIVVTLAVTVTGLVLYAVEGRLFDPSGLPDWVRPTAFIVWTFCAAHVAIRLVMTLWKGGTAATRFIASIPQRRRQTAYNQPVIDRLLATEGVEMLCYALFRRENHLWVNSKTHYRDPRWLTRLRLDGLVDLNSADWGVAHYSIHPVAWNYMQKYPNKFINRLRWRDWPWTIDFDEDKAEKQIEELKKEPSNVPGSMS